MLTLTKYFSRQEKEYICALLCICIVVYTGRVFFSGTLHYMFMPWNLFLGGIPLVFSRLAREKVIQAKSRWIIPAYILLWLLFFPNSHYMLTDLYHFNIRPGMPQWYDLIFLLSFAWTGIMLGLMSLWDIEQVLRYRDRERWIPYVSTFILFLAGFGIYLGRDLRWNSWDFFTNPAGLFRESIAPFLSPLEYSDAWGLTMLMGVFLNIIYWSFRLFSRHIK